DRMNEDRLERDSEQASLLQHLLETPIGRRWLLKTGLASAAAVAVANLPAWSSPSSVLAQVGAGGGQSAGGGPAGVTLQFALGAALAGVGVQPTPVATSATDRGGPSTTPGPARPAAGAQAPDRLVFGAMLAADETPPPTANATATRTA